MNSIKKMRPLILLLLLSGCAQLATKEATVACQSVDSATTFLAVKSGGGMEANPILARVLHSFGWGGFFFLKAVLTVALLKLHDEVSPVAIATVNGTTCLASISNWRFIR